MTTSINLVCPGCQHRIPDTPNRTRPGDALVCPNCLIACIVAGDETELRLRRLCPADVKAIGQEGIDILEAMASIKRKKREAGAAEPVPASSPSPVRPSAPSGPTGAEDFFDNVSPIDHKQECPDLHMEPSRKAELVNVDGDEIPTISFVAYVVCVKHGKSPEMSLGFFNPASAWVIPDFGDLLFNLFKILALEHDKQLGRAAGTELTPEVKPDETVM